MQCACRGQDALEDLRLAAHVELRRRLVEQDDAGAHLDGAERAGQRDALPLAAREIGAALVAARQHRVESRELRGARGLPAPRARPRRAHLPGATLSRSGSSKRMKSWKTAASARSPCAEIEIAQVDAVDFDRAALRVVQPAQQLGERRLARAVLTDDRKRGAGGNREIEAVEDRARRQDRRRPRCGSESRAPAGRPPGVVPTSSAARGGHRRLQAPDRGHRRRRAVQRPVETAERDGDVPTAHCA